MLTFKLRHLVGAVVAGTALFAATADARSPWRPRPAPPQAFSVRVEDEQGIALPTFRHEGRVFVLGTPGERYNVRVSNPTSERVEAVISVDGRDAISGQVGDFVSQRGYLVPAFGTVLVEGFRRSMDDVAAFRFTDPENSFSARRGTPQNVGVIGVAFFKERERKRDVIVTPPRPHHRKSAEAADGEAPSASAPAKGKRGAGRAEASEPRSSAENNLGTEFGERRHSAVVEVPFERMNPARPNQISNVRYDDVRGLEARGIDLSSLGRRRFVRVSDEPEAFPVSRFAEPPQ
jgi:hypothetical protein